MAMQHDATTQHVQRIVEVALEGEHRRGDNGAVLIDKTNDAIVYLLSHEFQPAQFRTQLESLLSDDRHKHIFVVHKDDSHMHITKIPRM